MKVLIVGIGRSGTTMTYRLFRSHPEIKGALLEQCILLLVKNRKQLENKYPCFKKSCCEKINYTRDKIRKPHIEVEETIYDYCNLWLDWFKDEARIVNIIRHPLDTIYSAIAKRGRRMGIVSNGFKGFENISKNISENMVNNYFKISPKYPEMISKLPQTITVKYEDMVGDYDKHNQVFNFCGLSDYVFPERRKIDRIFAYKNNGFRIDRPITNVVKTFNRIAKGVKYHDPSGKPDYRTRRNRRSS